MSSRAEEGIVEQNAEQIVGEQKDSTPPTLQKVLSIKLISDFFIKYIGIPERRSLRATCHFSRDLLRCYLLKIKKFKIIMVGNGGPLGQLGTGGSIAFKSDTEERLWSRRRNIEDNPDLGRFMRRDLKSMVLDKNTVIEELLISHQNSMYLSQTATPFITDLRLNVVKFHITGGHAFEIRDGLTILNPRMIQEIWIDAAEPLDYRFSDPDHFAHWKLQWKMAKVMISKMPFQTRGFVQNFAHFDYAHCVMDHTRISLEVLENLKNTLLLRPTVQKFEIVPTRYHYARDPLFIIPPRSFRPFQDPTNPAKFIFSYPHSQEVLTFEISYDGIAFKGPAYSGDKDVRKEVPRERILEELVENEARYDEEPYFFN